MIILDFGSGETCRNDKRYVKRMIDELIAATDDKRNGRDIIIKWQLFTKVPAPVRPLEHSVFEYAVGYAYELGYRTTASVFDADSLRYLLTFPNLPFIKIAARPHLYWMIGEIPYTTSIVVSAPNVETWNRLRIDFSARDMTVLCCIAEYPASVATYRNEYGGLLHYGISDHTEGLDLFRKYDPLVWEKHYCLEDSEGPDAAGFAIRPGELEGVLG